MGAWMFGLNCFLNKMSKKNNPACNILYRTRTCSNSIQLYIGFLKLSCLFYFMSKDCLYWHIFWCFPAAWFWFNMRSCLWFHVGSVNHTVVLRCGGAARCNILPSTSLHVTDYKAVLIESYSLDFTFTAANLLYILTEMFKTSSAAVWTNRYFCFNSCLSWARSLSIKEIHL